MTLCCQENIIIDTAAQRRPHYEGSSIIITQRQPSGRVLQYCDNNLEIRILLIKPHSIRTIEQVINKSVHGDVQ